MPENTGSAFAIIGSTNEESRHGHKVRSCFLKTVPLGFDGIVEVELISWVSSIPEMTMEL